MSISTALDAPQAKVLFREIEKIFPHKTLGKDKWYLVALSCLSYAKAEAVGTLYTHLTSQAPYLTPPSRQALVRRLREGLVKNVSIIGVCKPIEAISAIAAVEKDEDRDFSCSREGWRSGKENLERGEKWLNRLYQGNLEQATSSFKAHRDFDFISREITYGFYLSDHSVLNGIETELVVISGIMIQNFNQGTAWHLRAMRRLGISAEDIKLVQRCIELVAEFGGIVLKDVPKVEDIEHEV